MTMRRFTGSITAMATPFREDGSIATADLEKLVERQIEGGIDALIPVGTTGESPTLNHEEHNEVVEIVIAAAKGSVPVIAGAGSNSTREAISLTKHADAAGADATLHVTGYYNKPSQEGLFQHFSAIASETDKPIILYSIPSRCVVEIAVDTVERLASAFPNIRHIKESGGSVDRVDKLKQAMGDELTVLSGDDSLTLPFICSGAEGVVSVTSNIFPAEVGALTRAAMGGDLKTAAQWHRKLYPIFKNLFAEPSPVPIKTCLKRMGIFESDRVRLPLCQMPEESKRELLEILDRTILSFSTAVSI